MFLKKRSLLILLALTMVVAMLAACTPRDTTVDDDPADPTPPVVIEPPDDWDGVTIGYITPDFLEDIAERYSVSDHTVGWIDVPGTNINAVVVRNPDCNDNLYYLRRNFYRESYFDGVYYIDVRALLGPTREYLGVNTTIYGHAMADDPEDPAFDRKFGNLHLFRDPFFLLEHPYIFFSLPEENLAFEIFAVFYGNVDNPEFFYNDNPGGRLSSREDASEFIDMINNEVLPRSLFHFEGIELNENDRFLTLSTCIYNPSCGTELLHHTQTMYRFAIMARLVDPDEPRKMYADFVANEDRISDPDGRWAQVNPNR